MYMVKEEFKDNGVNIERHSKPRDRKKQLFGEEFELFVLDCLKDVGLSRECTWHPFGRNGRIDILWSLKNVEMECKRLYKTEFVDLAWCYENIINRFAEDAIKLCIVTERKWSRTEEALMNLHRIKIIETGQINTQRERKKARKAFINQFLELLTEKIEVVAA